MTSTVQHARLYLVIVLGVVVGVVLLSLNSSFFNPRNATFLESKALLPGSTTKQSMPLSAWDIAKSEAEQILLQSTSQETISCFVADKSKTQTVVKDALAGKYKSSGNSSASDKGKDASRVPLPVLNLGMPKCGSTSQFEFFKCAGYKSSHYVRYETHQVKKKLGEQNVLVGTCMRDASNLGLPVLSTCGPNFDALTEIDATCNFGRRCNLESLLLDSQQLRDDCFFPQLSLLEEIHNEDPTATFLLPFRSVEEWIFSFENWFEGLDSISMCNLPNLPRGIPDLDKPRTDQIKSMKQFLCSHVVHVRNFVKAHPSHALIEYDLYDNEFITDLFGKLFPSVKNTKKSANCWQQWNVNKGNRTWKTRGPTPKVEK